MFKEDVTKTYINTLVLCLPNRWWCL